MSSSRRWRYALICAGVHGTGPPGPGKGHAGMSGIIFCCPCKAWQHPQGSCLDGKNVKRWAIRCARNAFRQLIERHRKMPRANLLFAGLSFPHNVVSCCHLDTDHFLHFLSVCRVSYHRHGSIPAGATTIAFPAPRIGPTQ